MNVSALPTEVLEIGLMGLVHVENVDRRKLKQIQNVYRLDESEANELE